MAEYLSRARKIGKKAFAIKEGFSKGNYNQVIAQLGSLFAQPRASSAKASVSKVVNKTPLKSYLDSKYQKKCGVEVKQNDTANSGVLSALLSLLPITQFNMGIAQGLNDQQRTGNSIETKSLGFRIRFNTTAINADTEVRMFLVRISEPSAAPFTPGNILQNTAEIMSFPQLDKVMGFTIIKEWKFTLGPSVSKGSRHEINYWHNPSGCEQTQWTQADTTGLQANCLKGLYSVYAMYQTSGAIAPNYTWTARFSYVDV